MDIERIFENGMRLTNIFVKTLNNDITAIIEVILCFEDIHYMSISIVDETDELEIRIRNKLAVESNTHSKYYLKSSIIGSNAYLFWKMMNNKGYNDVFQCEFIKDGVGDINLQLKAIAGYIIIYDVQKSLLKVKTVDY